MTDEQLTLKTLRVRARELRRAEQNGDAYFMEKTAETLNRVVVERDELLQVLEKASKALHYELTIGDHNAITRMVDTILQEAGDDG